jgi:hypothetical protein
MNLKITMKNTKKGCLVEYFRNLICTTVLFLTGFLVPPAYVLTVLYSYYSIYILLYINILYNK